MWLSAWKAIWTEFPNSITKDVNFTLARQNDRKWFGMLKHQILIDFARSVIGLSPASILEIVLQPESHPRSFCSWWPIWTPIELEYFLNLHQYKQRCRRVAQQH
ncbi:uncharacterized protein LOC111111558 [Crassostrea virginica]